jgi:uncharacterized protein YecT (DUF1311 family)
MKKATLATLAFLMCSVHAMATNEDLTALQDDFDNCNAAASTTLASKQCNNEAYDKADAVLNVTYKSITAKLTAPDADAYEKQDNAETLRRLKAAQIAWINLRDIQCELEGTAMLGGTGEGVVIGACLYMQTVERVRDLRKLFEEQP